MLRVGVLGVGHWGPHLVRNFEDGPSSCVTWVADRDPTRLKQVGVRFPAVKLTDDVNAVLGAKDVDAVVVATPTSTHYSLARATLEAGKHVLVEKPLATSRQDAEELAALASSRDLVLMVGHVFLYNAAIQTVKDYLISGALGRLYHISMVRTNLGPIRTDVDAAWDLAPHDISIANHWLGSVPNSVSVIGGGWINEGLFDAVFGTLRYSGDVLVNLHISWLNPRKTRDITIVGESKMLTVDDLNPSEPIRIYDKGISASNSYTDMLGSFRSTIREGDVIIPRVPQGEPLRAECDHFVECVTAGTIPLTDGRGGLDVVRVLEAMQRSMAAGGQETRVE